MAVKRGDRESADDGGRGDWTRIRHQLSSLRAELERLQEQAEQAALEAARPQSVTVQELADQYHVDPAMIVEFARTIGEVLGGRDDPGGDIDLSPEAARRGALLTVAEAVWEGELGPLIDTAQARDLLDVSRQRVHELAGVHRLIVLRDRSGRLRLPLFQFRDGEPDRDLVAAFWALAEHASGWTAASWLATSNDALQGASPVMWLRNGGDPETIRALAAEDAERLAH